MSLLHNWKFNGNTYDGINNLAPITANSIPGHTGVDLIIQPQQLNVNTLVQHTRDITSVSFPDGPRGKYLKWDGTNECAAYAEVGYHAGTIAQSSYPGIVNLDRGVTITMNPPSTLITCWVKVDSGIRPGFKLDGTRVTHPIDVDFSPTAMRFTLNDVEFGDTVAYGEWCFISVTLRSNDPVHLYAATNGKSETKVPFDISIYVLDEPYSSLLCYDGLDDLRIYQRESNDYYKAVYNLGLSVELGDDIECRGWRTPKRQYWFDNSSADNINPNPYYNPVTNTFVSYAATIGPNASFADGKLGKALRVGRDNRTTQLIDNNATAKASYPVLRSLNDTPGNFAIAYWISLDHNLTAPISYNELYVNNVFGNLSFHKDYGYSLIGDYNHGFLPLATYPNFDHLSFVYQKRYGRTVIYVNGIPRAQLKYTISQVASNQDFGTTINFAGPTSNNTFNGLAYFDDVRTYATDLTSCDVQALYSKGLGTQGSVSSNFFNHSNSAFLNFKYSRSFSAYNSLAGSVIVSHVNKTVLSKEYPASQSIDSRLIYAFTSDHDTASNMLGEGNKRHRASTVNCGTFNVLHSVAMNLLKTYHSTSSYLVGENYLYPNNVFAKFTGQARARYSAPLDIAPLMTDRPAYIFGKELYGKFATPTGGSVRINNFVPKFPKNPLNGNQIIDKYGNKWTYNANYAAWISKGDTTPPEMATETKNGIITPEIYNKIRYLSTWQGKIPTRFKLSPNTDAYYYYFTSSDGLIDFAPESGTDLRIEVNKGRLFSILYKQSCQGEKGLIGPQGLKGPAGYLAKSELAFVPTFTPTTASFKIFTTTPLYPGGPVKLENRHVPDISIRLYDLSGAVVVDNPTYNQINYLNRYFFDEPDMLKEIALFSAYLDKIAIGVDPNDDNSIPPSRVYSDTYAVIGTTVLAEILVDPLGVKYPRLTVFDPSINITLDVPKTLESIRYDDSNNFTMGSFIFNGDVEPYSYGIRIQQKGVDGVFGDTGSSCLQIKECVIDGQNIVATCPIVNVRLDCEEQVFYSTCAQLLGNLCVQYIALQANNNVLNDRPTMESTFLSVETTLNDNKLVLSYKPELRATPQLDLDLTNWTPTDECRKARHFGSYSFLWDDGKPLSCAPAVFANGVLDALGQLASAPKSDGCCAEPFFYFPAIQNGVCTTTGTGGTVPPVTSSSGTSSVSGSPVSSSSASRSPASSISSRSSASIPPGVFAFSNSIKLRSNTTQLTNEGSIFYNAIADSFGGSLTTSLCAQVFLDDMFGYFDEATEYQKINQGFASGNPYAVYGSKAWTAMDCEYGDRALLTKYLVITLDKEILDSNGSYNFTFSGVPSNNPLYYLNSSPKSYLFDLPNTGFPDADWVRNRNYLYVDISDLSSQAGQPTWFRNGSSGFVDLSAPTYFYRLLEDPAKNPTFQEVLIRYNSTVTIEW